jgi:hypothetical protein
LLTPIHLSLSILQVIVTFYQARLGQLSSAVATLHRLGSLIQCNLRSTYACLPDIVTFHPVWLIHPVRTVATFHALRLLHHSWPVSAFHQPPPVHTSGVIVSICCGSYIPHGLVIFQPPRLILPSSVIVTCRLAGRLRLDYCQLPCA